MRVNHYFFQKQKVKERRKSAVRPKGKNKLPRIFQQGKNNRDQAP